MKKAVATIRWLSYSEGGRQKPVPPGIMYYPHIKIDRSIDVDPWSVCFRVTPSDNSRCSTISFSMLVDNEETRLFFSKLCVGMNFLFLEGMQTVAVGQIQEIV